MTKLQNGSQVTVRPARKPTAGTAGYFSESNDNSEPSYPGQDWFNDIIDEFQNALILNGITYKSDSLNNLARAIQSFKQYGIGGVNDFRGTVYSSGNPEDLFGKGTLFGFCDTASLGIDNRGLYGSLTIFGQYYDGSALSSVYRSFVNQFGQLFQFPVSNTEWGPWISSFNTNKMVFDVVGSNDIKLTSVIGRIGSLSNYDEFTFDVVSTNTDLVTIEVDGLGLYR